MSLSDFKPQTTTITVKGVTFAVRGLSMIDCSELLRVHMNDLESLFEMYEQESQNLTFGNVAMARYATRLISDAPGLVAHMIALASDEPEAVNQAAKLPMMAQINALKAIGVLTFEEVGGVKKLLQELGSLVEQVRPNLPLNRAQNAS